MDRRRSRIAVGGGGAGEGADTLVHAALEHVPGRFRGGEGDDLAGYLRANVGGGLALLADGAGRRG